MDSLVCICGEGERDYKSECSADDQKKKKEVRQQVFSLKGVNFFLLNDLTLPYYSNWIKMVNSTHVGLIGENSHLYKNRTSGIH